VLLVIASFESFCIFYKFLSPVQSFCIIIDDLTKIFAMEAKNSSLYAGNLVIWSFFIHTQRHGKPIRSLHTSKDTRSNTQYLPVASLKCKSFFKFYTTLTLFNTFFFQISPFFKNS